MKQRVRYLTLVHLDLLKEELERVLGALYDDLLEEIFKEFVNLVLIEIA